MTEAGFISHNFWDTRYSSDAYIFGKEPSQFVSTYAYLIPPKSRVFLPADGEGRNSVFLAKLGHEVSASDYSEVGLQKARRLAAEHTVTVDFKAVDLKGYDWPENAYDAVVAVFIQFADPSFRKAIFTGLMRTVRPGGLILLHGYTPKQLEYRTGGPDEVANLYTKPLLSEAFSDCETLTLKAYDRHLDEGTHKGRSALIDLVARKI